MHMRDESKASATNVYTPINANTFQWKSIGRQVNGMFPSAQPDW